MNEIYQIVYDGDWDAEAKIQFANGAYTAKNKNGRVISERNIAVNSESIAALAYMSEADSDRLSRRLKGCNVRVKYFDGRVVPHQDFDGKLLNRHDISNLLTSDPLVDCVEYNFNGQWITV